MERFDNAERFTEAEMRELVAVWLRLPTPLTESLLPSFDGHPDRPLAVRVIEEMTRPKKQIREIRFTPPCDRFDRWQKAADALGIPLTIWVQLAADGLLHEPRETATAPVQETTQDRNPLVRPDNGWLRERIVAEVGDQPFFRSEVPSLAEKMGEPRQKVFASLNSAVNSKRATFDGNVYQFVKE